MKDPRRETLSVAWPMKGSGEKRPPFLKTAKGRPPRRIKGGGGAVRSGLEHQLEEDEREKIRKGAAKKSAAPFFSI